MSARNVYPQNEGPYWCNKYPRQALATAHGKVRREMTAIPFASGGGSQRIIFDGLNLSLARGTGIATYTRMLTRAAHDLGHEVGVLYSTPFTPAKDRLLREIAFFDEKRASMSGKRKLTLRRALNHAIDQTRYHLPVKPLPVELSGAVVARQFKRTLDAHDRVFIARNLFANARTYLSRTKAFVNLAFEPRPGILHCTYPLPLRVKSARNVYTIHDLVPLRLPFTTEDNKRQLFRLLKKIAKEADHIVTVSENSKRDIIELLGVDERRISNTYQTVDFPREWIERPASAVANQLEGHFGLGLYEYLLFYGALEPKKNVRRSKGSRITSRLFVDSPQRVSSAIRVASILTGRPMRGKAWRRLGGRAETTYAFPQARHQVGRAAQGRNTRVNLSRPRCRPAGDVPSQYCGRKISRIAGRQGAPHRFLAKLQQIEEWAAPPILLSLALVGAPIIHRLNGLLLIGPPAKSATSWTG